MLSRLSRTIGNIGVEETHHAFATESWNGSKWPKHRRPQGHPLLQKTGRMKASVRVDVANSKRVKWSAHVPYADFHNAGTSRIPQRRFIGMTDRVRRRIDKAIKDEMQKVLSK